MPDKELLEHLGLADFDLITDKEEREKEVLHKRYLFLTEDDEWTHLMDNWYYTLWHNKIIRERIKSLSEKFDIFTCSFGDCDESFDFAYFEKGKIIRQYVVEDPEFNGGEVVTNFGNPFPIEKTALNKKDLDEKVLMIAQSFGIKTKHEKGKIRVYGRFENQTEKFGFNEEE